LAVTKRKIPNKSGKKSEYWYVEVSIPGGRKIKKSVGKVGQITKAVAREYEQEIKKKIKLGQLGVLQLDIPTLTDFSKEYLNYKRDVDKKRSWKRDEELLVPLNKLLGHKRLSDIKVKDIEEFKIHRLKEVKSSTVNRSLSVLKHLFNLAKKWEKFYGDNPVSTAGLLEENNLIQRILTPKEEESLLHNSAPHLQNVIIVALNTGMRIGEIQSLKWKDVYLENNIITVDKTNSKSKKEHSVYINSILRKLLLEIRLKSGQEEYVFLNDDGNRIKNITTAFKNARKRSGLSDLRFHDLRHTAATRMVESGVNIVAISKILGHSDIKTTMRYAHPEESLKDALESLGNFGKTTTNIATNGISSIDGVGVTS